MKRVFLGLGAMLVLLGSVGLILWKTLPTPSVATNPTTPITNLLTDYHLGVNFFIFDELTPPPKEVAKDLAILHAGVSRQLSSSDTLWNAVNPKPHVWQWEKADSALSELSKTTTPIATLFSLQYASPTAPWQRGENEFHKNISPETETYIRTVIQRYKNTIHYWEIGNEMDHWRSEDPYSEEKNDTKAPRNAPKEGFSPKEQGEFFAGIAKIIREEDATARIVMPGMSDINDYTLNTWLPEVLASAGTETFDVINAHLYGPWETIPEKLPALTKKLQELGIENKPIWITETGSTADETLTLRTNYPNSETSQANDIMRRALLSYASGANMVLWHTYASSPDQKKNTWRGYGLYTEKREKTESFDAFAKLASYFPAKAIEQKTGKNGEYIFKITPIEGNPVYVRWEANNKPILSSDLPI